MTRYPLAPLAAALGIHLGTIGGQQPDQPPEGHTALAEALGLSRERIKQLARDGLSDEMAERHAVNIGWLPYWIWPEWIHSTDPDLDGHAADPCRCKTQSRPLGRICDRCGHDLPRRRPARPQTAEPPTLAHAS